VRLEEFQVLDLHGVLAADGSDYPGHGVRVAAAIERGARVVQVDTLERRGEAVRVTLAADLSVGDDVESNLFLHADRQRRGVVLGPG
jgi:hypothetical protein